MSLNASFTETLERFVEKRIAHFHERRAENITKLKLLDLLKAKNPYLFKAKNFESAPDLVNALLEARLSSAEEGLFGQFLEDLAVFIAEQKCGGRKSGITGIDLELERDGKRYLIAVKSGKAWGNATQHTKLRDNFRTALKVLRQNQSVGQLQPTLGICYADFPKQDNGLYLHIGGQEFWELISHEPDLYMDIVEPIGYKARAFNEDFQKRRDEAINRMVREFTETFCLQSGSINWFKLVELVSKNRSLKSVKDKSQQAKTSKKSVKAKKSAKSR